MKSKFFTLIPLLLQFTQTFSQSCIPPDTSIIAWWSFDDTTSASIKDISGNHDGVFVDGTLYSSGEVENAAKFTESNYIGIADDDVWAWGYNNFSIEFWETLSAPGGSLQHPEDIFICTSNGPGEDDKWWFALGNGVLSFHVNHNAPFWYAQTPFSPVLNQWYHLAVTRSGDTLRVYIDGELSGSEVVPGLFIYNPNAPLTLGIGEGIGLMSGQLDEMTIYGRALSDEEIFAIYSAGTSGKCKPLQITTPLLSDVKFGEPFSQTLEATFGVSPLVWTVTEGHLPNGVTLSEDGTISGTSSEGGEFSITVQVTDSSGAVAEKDFVLNVLLTLPESQFTIFKSGTVPVPGRDIDYFILVQNIGSVTDTAVMTEFLEPWFTFKSSNLEVEVISQIQNYHTVDITDSLPSVIRWKVILSPGESKTISYKVNLDPNFPLNTTVKGCACLTPFEQFVCYDLYVACKFAAGVTCFSLCMPATPIYTPAGAAACLAACSTFLFFNCDVALIACIYDQSNDANPECSCDSPKTKGAVDPNEMLVLADKYIQRDKLITYVIEFENIGTIEAQNVFVTDVLDTSLDASTLNILSSSGSSYDPMTRTLRWELNGINLQVDSSAYVTYSIRPKQNLPSGTVIPNKATIQFEVFSPINTNEVVNIIDATIPEGVMNVLPDTSYQTTFPISWHVIDPIGEIKQYSVFIAEDSAAYKLFITTKDTTTLFTGEAGKTYHFTCIAEDLAGNTELQSSVAETSTHLVIPCINKYFRDADNDGYGNINSTTLACTQPTGYVSDSTDCNDGNATINPGAAEVCNSFIDDNCNGQIDEGVNVTMYLDADSDGYGNPFTYAQVCSPVAGYVFDNTDCSDTSSTIHPGAIELCNEVDDNCNGQIDEECTQCPLPGSLSSTNIKSTSVKLSWNNIEGAAGYKIRYKVAGTHEWLKHISTNTYKKLQGLSPGTEYVWEIKTYCEIEPNFMSDWSTAQHFTTASLRTGDELLQPISLEIYPVPAKDFATIEFTLPQSTHVCIKVYDVNGKEREILLNEEIEQGDHSLLLNTTHFSKGVYLVKAIYDWGFETEKVIVE